MGSASGSKFQNRSRPMKRELPLPPPPSNPQIDSYPNPNPKLDFAVTTPSMPEADAGSSAVSIDGADEDEAIRRAVVLSREEVLRRRSRRLRQLLGYYRQHYWVLMEGMRVKHRKYYWEHGKSPIEDDGGGAEENGSAAPAAAVGEGSGESGRPGGLRLGFGQGENGGCGNVERLRCAFGGCKAYAIPLTTYCHPHILMDSKQTLYKACSFVIKSSHTSQIICGKPVLRATVPSLCPAHFKLAEKHVSQALKRAGLNASSSNRHAPKFHVIIAEYVRQIQAKRRRALSTTVEDVADG